MSKENLTRQERLETKSVKALTERSRGLNRSYVRLLNFDQVVESPEFVAKHPECDITDPSADEFIDNTIQFANTFGPAFKKIEEKTLPKLKELKEENDEILQKKISTIEAQRIDALSLSPQQKKSLLGFLEQQLEQLEELAEKSSLHSDVALRMTRARIATLSNVKTVEETKPTKKRADQVIEEEKNIPQQAVESNIVIFPNGKTIEADGFKKIVLISLLARKYDYEDLAEQLFGNRTPDSVDSAINWVKKVSSEDLFDVGFSIVEVTVKGKTIVTALEEKNLDTEFAQLQKELRQSKTPNGKERNIAKKVSPEEYEARLKVFEHILGQSFGRISVTARMGKNAGGKRYGWTTAKNALHNSRQTLYSRVLHNTATVRERRIYEAMIKAAPADLKPDKALIHFANIVENIMRNDEFGHFGTYTPLSKEEQEAMTTQPIQLDESESVDILFEEDTEDEVFELEEAEVEEIVLKEEELPNLAAVALALTKSDEQLPEEFEIIRKKIAEDNHIGTSNPLDEIKKLHDILSDENKAAEYVFSFEDNEDVIDFMMYLEENKELLHDLLPEEEEEFEIGPNGQLITKSSKETSYPQTQLESKIPNLKELVREKFAEVRANGAFKGITPADQITAVYHGIKHSDIEFAVSQKIVRPSTGGKSKMYVFDQVAIVTLLIKTQYRSLTLTPKMRRELVNLVEQTEREMNEEEKAKKGYESSSK